MSSTFANLLGPKQGQLYKLILSKPLGLQFTRNDGNGAFAVSGHDGFDEDRNGRPPTLGARLLQIGNDKVDEQGWTSVEELQRRLDASDTVKLRFRTENAGKSPRPPTSEGEMATRVRAFSGEAFAKKQPMNLMKFWNFQHHGLPGDVAKESKIDTDGRSSSPVGGVLCKVLKISPPSTASSRKSIVSATSLPSMPVDGDGKKPSSKGGKLFAFRP